MTEYQVSELYKTIRESNPEAEMFGADLWLNFTIDFKEGQSIPNSMESVIETYQLADHALNKLNIRHDGIDYTPDNLSLSIGIDQKSIDHFKFYFRGEFVCTDDLNDNLITEQQWLGISKEFEKLISNAKLPVTLRGIQSKISIIVDWGEKINGYRIHSEGEKLLNSITPLMHKWNLSDNNIFESGEWMSAKYLVKEHMNLKPTDCTLFNFYNAMWLKEG